MKLVKLTLLFVMIAIVAAFPQKITKVNRPYVLIDISASSGVSVGDKMDVIRQIGPGQTKNIGKVEIVVFKRGKCAGKIISETSSYPIRVGDQIQLKSVAAAPKRTTPKLSYKPAGSANYIPTYISVAAGVAALGVSYYYWDQAEQSAKDYEAMSYTNKQINYLSTSQDLNKYDNLSNSFRVAGGCLIFGGVAYYLWTRSHTSTLSSTIDVQPVYASNYKGLNFSLSFNHPKK